MDKCQMFSVFFVVVCVAAVTSEGQAHHVGKRSETCVLPPYPEHGTYEKAGDSSAKPGDVTSTAYLNVTCSPGYGVIGNNVVICLNGLWSTQMPQCVRHCRLSPNPSVEYHCMDSTTIDSRPCNELEPSGVTVRPECRRPNYYSAGPSSIMRCIDGAWDHVATCSPECGKIPEKQDLILEGKKANSLPWHAEIYKKSGDDYMLLCGGSIIGSTFVVTAAHCFWGSKKIIPSDYSVAVGKTQYGWDKNGQNVLVEDVNIPARYLGAATNFQDDIALVRLSSALTYSPLVRPVCLDFDLNFDRRQLRQGNVGKVTVWSASKKNDYFLQVLELPYIPIEECLHKVPVDFREYITSDKICAGHANGTVICRGNSGSGLSFPESERGVTRYYLRGIVSTSPNTPDGDRCGPVDVITLTQVTKHEHFLKEHL